jgi:hypothetical protein
VARLEILMRSVPVGFKPSKGAMRIYKSVRKQFADAKAQGEARGKAEAVLAVLVARGVAVSGAERERILSCTDRKMLDRWIGRAVQAASVADVTG